MTNTTDYIKEIVGMVAANGSKASVAVKELEILLEEAKKRGFRVGVEHGLRMMADDSTIADKAIAKFRASLSPQTELKYTNVPKKECTCHCHDACPCARNGSRYSPNMAVRCVDFDEFCIHCQEKGKDE